MPDRPPQSATSHTRWYPLYHFFAFPAVAVGTIYRLYIAATAPTTESLLMALFACGVTAAVFAARVMAIAVQDRVIRLEETLRMQRLLPAAQQAGIAALDRRQVVSLRFASDAELPELVARVTSGELTTGRAIKGAIRDWRADWHRA